MSPRLFPSSLESRLVVSSAANRSRASSTRRNASSRTPSGKLGNIRVFPRWSSRFPSPHHHTSYGAFRFFRYINISLLEAGESPRSPTSNRDISLILYPSFSPFSSRGSSISSLSLYYFLCGPLSPEVHSRLDLPLRPRRVAMAIRVSTTTTKLCFRHISSELAISLIHYSFILHFFFE